MWKKIWNYLSKEQNDKFYKFVNYVIKAVGIILVLLTVFFLIGIVLSAINWSNEENEKIQKCVSEGGTFDACYARYNW